MSQHTQEKSNESSSTKQTTVSPSPPLTNHTRTPLTTLLQAPNEVRSFPVSSVSLPHVSLLNIETYNTSSCQNILLSTAMTSKPTHEKHTHTLHTAVRVGFLLPRLRSSTHSRDTIGRTDPTAAASENMPGETDTPLRGRRRSQQSWAIPCMRPPAW